MNNLFVPSDDLVKNANITKVALAKGFSSFKEFYDWSVKSKSDFWLESVKQLDLKFEVPFKQVLDLSLGLKNPIWFKGAKLNIVDSCFQSDSSNIAIKYANETNEIEEITYADLNNLVLKYINGLQKRNYLIGTKFVIYMPMSITSVALYLALIAAGMIVVSVPDSFSGAELAKRMNIVEADIIFTTWDYQYNKKSFVLIDKVRASGAKQVFIENPKGELMSNEFDLSTLCQSSNLGEVKFVYSEPDSVTNILFSSGTTKDPKAIPWTHLTHTKSAIDGFYHQDIKPEDVVTWTTGMGWMMAPWLIFATFLNKATLAIYEGAYQLESYGQFVEDAKVSIMGTIPSLVRIWKASEVMEQFDWNIRVFTSTGEPSNETDYLYLQSLSNIEAPVIEYCGGTEIGGAYLTNTVVEPSLISAFSTPTLGTELVFLDSANLEVEVGLAEAYISVPALGLSQNLLNYDHDLEYFKENQNLIEEKTLRKHGDSYELIKLEERTFYKCRGRTDDTFNLNGIKCSSVEIEQLLMLHGSFNDIAVVTFEERGLEKLAVFYCSEEPIDEVCLMSELQTMISTQLNPLFRISKIIKIDILPRTASGKLIRKDLRSVFS
jgi:acetyl-CoA synthetase